jgi:hypothetical protein
MSHETKTILLALAAAATVAGCSGGASRPAVSDPAPGDSTTGTVTFRATFPAPPVDPSLISTATTSIVVTWEPTSGATTAQNFGARTLTAGLPSTTVKLPVGRYYFTAEGKDALGASVEKIGTGGKVIAGDNAVAMTFLNGKWLFKNGAGADQPIELLSKTADGAAPLTVSGFYLSATPNQLQRSALDPSLSMMRNIYRTTYITNDVLNPYKETEIELYAQFGGGATNPSALDGAGYDLAANCGEFRSGPGGCNNNGPGALGDRSIRILGVMDGSGKDPSRKLLPQTFSQNIAALADTRIVDGLTISGHLLEYVFVAATTSIVTNASPPVTGSALPPPVTTAAQSAAVSLAGLVVSEGQPIVLCSGPDQGEWQFTNYCCDSGPCTPCGDCSVRDGLGNFLYATCGQLSPTGLPGTCTWGLQPATPGAIGEYCADFQWPSGPCRQAAPTNGIYHPWSFYDLNGDGAVDTGSLYFRQYQAQSFTLDGWAYPFTAKGSLVPQTMTITIQ